MDFEALDKLAARVRAGDEAACAGSTSERMYIALAANRADLLPTKFTIVEAFQRLDERWCSELMQRHGLASMPSWLEPQRTA